MYTHQTLWVPWTHCYVQVTGFRWLDLTVMCCIILLEAVIRKQVHCGRRGMNMNSKNTQRVCKENICHTITPPTPAWTVDTKHVVYAKLMANSDPITQMSQQKLRLIRPHDAFPIFYCSVYWACVNCGPSFLFLADSYCYLSISLTVSCHSPLTSGIMSLRPLVGYFLFFGPFSANPIDSCEEQPQ